MTLDSARVIWSEGLFLRPHHFQQLERYFESLLDARLSGTVASQGGFLKVQIDQARLVQGKVHIASAMGRFPDGTPFELPADTCVLDPFDVPEGTRDQTLYLSALTQRGGSKTVTLDGRGKGLRRTRYGAVDARVADNVVGFDAEADLKVGALNLTLGLQDSLDGSMTTLPVARIEERAAGGRVKLDDNFIPPLLDMSAHPRALAWIEELHGVIKQRADALAGRIAGAATGGVGDTADFLLLMVCNRYEPLLSQMRRLSPLHPGDAFAELLKLAGECSTFGRDTRRPPELPIYNHLSLTDCFEPVVEEIRQAVTRVIDQTAVRIPLRDLGKGLYRADVPDPRLVTNGYFVLAVTTQWPLERQRTEIPTKVKIGSTEKLKDLVTYNLPGIKLDVLQYPPRQMPFYRQYSYFQLETSNSLWSAIEVSRAMGLYVADNPPGLEMQLWAVRT